MHHEVWHLTLENNILFCKAMVGLEISHSLGNANISMLLHLGVAN